MHSRMGKPRFMTAMLALALAWPASAVEIDAIAIRSALGQPLLADIPIAATDAELRALRVSLAPAIVFARVGLARPQGAVGDLRFAIAEAQGRPVIRVTTAMPVEEEFFSFLVQVDWETGRMIREFSIALQQSVPAPWVDAPAAAASPPASDVDFGAIQAQDTGATAAAIPLAPGPAPAAAAAAPAPLAAPVPLVAAAPTTPPEPKAPGTAVTTMAKAQVERASDVRGDRYGPVAPGETLSHVTARAGYGGAMRAQAFVALLASNPHSFINGNINGLKRGAVLSLPSREAVAAIDSAAAHHLVALHDRGWRNGNDAAHAGELAQALAALVPAAPPVAPVPLAGGRLEIAAAAPDAGSAGPTHSATGIALQGSGSGGDDAASREAELQHVRAQLAELEGTVREMRNVIAAQDSALARAQEQLATAQREDAPAASQPWHWLLAGALLAALLAGLARLAARFMPGGSKDSSGAAPRWHRRTH